MSALSDTTQIAAILATVVAAGGICIAYRQWKSGVRSQQEATALGIWKDYIQLALAYPNLASPDESVLNGDRRSAQFRQYEWFVSAMLFACEQIVALQPHDREWRASIADHLKLHRVYLSNPGFVPDRYSLELRQLLSAVAGRAPGTRVV